MDLGQVELLPKILPKELVRRPPKLSLSRVARIVDHLELLDSQGDSPSTAFVDLTPIELDNRELRQLAALHQRNMPFDSWAENPVQDL